MHLKTAFLLTAILTIPTGVGRSAGAAATPCEQLAGLSRPNARIDSALMVAAGAFAPPSTPEGRFANLPAFCRVTATLTPSSDSDIKIEIWLPASWNGKLQAVGNGGWGGAIPYGALAAAMAAGYAAAGTDTGYHVGGNAEFAPGHPEKLIDLGYRSIHEMTVQAKTLIKAHYGAAARFSYFDGCSQGGRQGLAAAQKYPEDFNGIIAGDAGWNQMRVHLARVALNLVVNKDADRVIPPSKYPMIHNAVLNACDALDGVKDGVIENPMTCKFDYATLACPVGDAANCLTKGQVESAKAMTSPLKDPKTAKVLYDGHLFPGSELGWAVLGGPEPTSINILRTVVFHDRNWDYHTLDLSTDVDRADAADRGVMRSDDPNLRPFFDRGGKLLMFHGWNDPVLSPLNSVIYYNNVLKTVGKNRAANGISLFMVPGMDHCRGGVGTDRFDRRTVIEQWVEQGKRPSRIIASHITNGQVDKTRPLCPFPEVARYQGTGSTNDAANFSCVASTVPRPMP